LGSIVFIRAWRARIYRYSFPRDGMKRVRIAWICLGVTLAAGAEDEPAPGRFEALDRNRDGAVSFTEFAVSVKDEFTRLDADRDRALTRVEAAGFPRVDEVFVLPAFEVMDADGDGLLSLREVGGAARSVFDALDAMKGSKDAHVSRPEYEEAVRQRRSMRSRD